MPNKIVWDEKVSYFEKRPFKTGLISSEDGAKPPKQIRVDLLELKELTDVGLPVDSAITLVDLV